MQEPEHEDYSHLIPDPDEEIPDTFEEDELPDEDPLEILERCRESSGVAPLEEVKRLARQWMEGHQQADEVLRAWTELDAELGVRYHYFQDGLRFQEWTEEFVESGRSCFELFEWAGEQLQRLKQGLEEADPGSVAYALEQLHQVFGQLEAAYGRLQELTACPLLSAYPQVAELARVGQLVLRERLPAEALQERVQVFADLQGRLFDALQAASTTRREREILQAFAPQLEEARDRHLTGLEGLLRFLEEPDEELLEQSLACLEEAAALLDGLRQQLDGAARGEESIHCPFCSASNAAHHRFCSQCQARLPERGEPLEQNTLEDAGLGANFARLAAEVQQAMAGSRSPEQFSETLQWFEGLHRVALRQWKAITAPPARTPAEQRELFEEGQGLLETALGRVEEGLQALKNWVGEPEAGHWLSEGCELILEGGHQFAQLELLFERAQSLVAAQGSAHTT